MRRWSVCVALVSIALLAAPTPSIAKVDDADPRWGLFELVGDTAQPDRVWPYPNGCQYYPLRYRLDNSTNAIYFVQFHLMDSAGTFFGDGSSWLYPKTGNWTQQIHICDTYLEQNPGPYRLFYEIAFNAGGGLEKSISVRFADKLKPGAPGSKYELGTPCGEAVVDIFDDQGSLFRCSPAVGVFSRVWITEDAYRAWTLCASAELITQPTCAPSWVTPGQWSTYLAQCQARGSCPWAKPQVTTLKLGRYFTVATPKALETAPNACAETRIVLTRASQKLPDGDVTVTMTLQQGGRNVAVSTAQTSGGKTGLRLSYCGYPWTDSLDVERDLAGLSTGAARLRITLDVTSTLSTKALAAKKVADDAYERGKRLALAACILRYSTCTTGDGALAYQIQLDDLRRKYQPIWNQATANIAFAKKFDVSVTTTTTLRAFTK